MSLAENINEAFLRPSSPSLTARKSYHTHISTATVVAAARRSLKVKKRRRLSENMKFRGKGSGRKVSIEIFHIHPLLSLQ